MSEAAHRPAFRFFPSLLIFLLGGYLFFNKAFAWIHVPGMPIFLGEIVLAVGVYEAMGTRLAGPLVRRSAALKGIIALMAAGAMHMAWGFPVHGISAARDSALWYYAAFAILVVVALVADSGLLGRMLRLYERAIPLLLIWAPFAVILERGYDDSLPTIPDSTTSIVSFKAGDFAVHAAAAVAFLWLGMEHRTPRERRNAHLLTAIGLVGILVAGSQNRGGMASALVLLTIAFLYVPHKGRVFFSIVTFGLVALTLMLVLDVRVDLGQREISVQQLLANAGSVFGAESTTNTDLEGNITWRLELWGEVVDDIVYGDYFMTGFGFGPNLAEHYGFEGENERQPLRNAHNSHLTLIARMGIPGFVLWALLWVLWYGAMAARIGAPRQLRPGSTLAITVWVLTAVSGILFNAMFDPTLEGPQVGVWLWVLAGAGVALARGWASPAPSVEEVATATA